MQEFYRRFGAPPHRGKFIGLRYALRIFAGTIILWEIYGLFADRVPIWALVSMLMVSEIELHASVLRSLHRFLHMAFGCGVGLFFLTIWQPSIWQIALACAISGAASFYLIRIGGNWRTAPVATAIVVGAGFVHFTKNAGMHEAFIRTSEVLGGCFIALAVSWTANRVWRISEEVGEEVAEHL